MYAAPRAATAPADFVAKALMIHRGLSCVGEISGGNNGNRS